ncbi:MAG TPA: hypothetical protein VFW45_14705 [Candidatus Polarisedimenticolia bacterium]|nr:hypothetical protein [Candidatus Polarisedimenticolia bacterium]
MRTILSASALVIVMALLLGAAPASQGVSVGEFAVMLADRLSGDTDAAPLTAETASETLQKAGIKLRDDLTSPATEEDAVQAFRHLGITIQSQNGSAPLLRNQVQSLIGVFGSSLTAKASGTAPSKVSGPKQVSSLPTPSLDSITDCQQLPKTQDCQQCCRALFGSDQNDVHSNRICGKACNSKNREVSASEPTP